MAMCGASGIRYGVDTLRALGQAGVQTHLVMSRWAQRLLVEEGEVGLQEVRALAGAVHDPDDLAAPISSSSFLVDGMVVIPASVKTVAEIAQGYTHTLIARAADNMLKLRRPLLVCPRETPLSLPCLENLARLARAGAVVLPCSPGFYHRPQTLEDLVGFITGKVLDCLGIDNAAYRRWGGGAGA